MRVVHEAKPKTCREIENLLETAEGKLRADLLSKLAVLTGESDQPRSRRIAAAAFELAEELGYRRGKADALFALGDAARIAGEYRLALENYATSLNIFQLLGDPIQQGRCFRRLGDVHFFINNLNLSLKYYLSALKIFENAAEKGGSHYIRINLGHLMATIGNVLKDSGDLEGALDYYNQCHSIYTQEGFSAGIPGVLYNKGNVFFIQNRMDEALNIYKQALAEAEVNKDYYLVSMALNSIGSVFMAGDNLDSARNFFNQSMIVAEQHDRKRGILAATVKLVELGRLQKNYKTALDLSKDAEQLAGELDDRRGHTDILKERALVYQGMRKYKKAMETILLFEKLRGEILSEKRTRELDILRIRYETEVKEHKIELLKKERTIQRRMILASVAGLALAGVSLILVYRNVRFRTRVNKELADAYSRVEKLSRSDSLTGLANRRAMMRSLSDEQTRSSRTGRRYGLIMADIDDFKRVNDRYGHACGDEVLVEVASRMKKALRSQDFASRWGGEEFLLLLPETSLIGAARVAEKIRESIAATPFLCEKISINMTMTFGVSEGGGVPVDHAIQQADAAMYRAKRKGKNRVDSI
ncbi:MAG: GGDEF domain-containing protein [Candidatus Sabulitectum sp.]|nr:GGDEF domain-containing protein [Candidatus Sabulitectum sp.]